MSAPINHEVLEPSSAVYKQLHTCPAQDQPGCAASGLTALENRALFWLQEMLLVFTLS